MYSDDKIIIMSYDECGDEQCVATYRIPFQSGELSEDELDAMRELYLDRAYRSAGEIAGHMWTETTYRTSTAIQAQEDRLQELYEKYLDETEDEDEARELAEAEIYGGRPDWF